jgi:hypothetical protein
MAARMPPLEARVLATRRPVFVAAAPPGREKGLSLSRAVGKNCISAIQEVFSNDKQIFTMAISRERNI